MSYSAVSESDYCWYRRDPDDLDVPDPRAHEKLIHVLRRIQRDQSYRKRADLMHGAMYGDIPVQGLTQDSYSKVTPGGESSLSLNVSRNVVDAVTARVFAKSDPHLTYTTEGADYEKQHNAEMLERGVDGTFYQSDFYAKAANAGRLGCIFGDGLLRIEPDWDKRKVSVRKWMRWELLVDDSESTYEDEDEENGPTCFYATKYWDKYRLLHLVHKRAEDLGIHRDDVGEICEKIDRMQGERDDDAEFGYQQRALRVAVYEGWHHPSGEGAEDGRYVMAVGNTWIVDRPWDGKLFPFGRFSWSEAVVGWYGQGLIEQGRGIQREINYLVRQFQQGHHLIAGGWLVEAGSKVISAHVNNDLSKILKWTGTKPEYYEPVVIEPQKYQHLWNLVQRYYQMAGLNEQAVHAERPAGVDSGEAQRVYAEQQDVTLMQRGKTYERFVKKCGELVTGAAKMLADNGGYEVRADVDDGFETIDWGKLDDPDGYEAKIMPTSQLPSTPTGKIQLGFDLMKIGDVDSGDVMELIGMSDVLQKTQLKLAWRKRVERDIGLMLREKQPRIPDAFLNIDGAIALANDEYNLAIVRLERCVEAGSMEKDDAEERAQLVRDYLVELKKIKAPPQPQQAIAPSGGGLMQPGMPAPLLPERPTGGAPGPAPPGGGPPGAPAPNAPPAAQPQPQAA